MALRQIRLYDDQILRKKSKVVEVVDDKTGKYSMKIYHNKLIFTLLGKLKMIN